MQHRPRFYASFFIPLVSFSLTGANLYAEDLLEGITVSTDFRPTTLQDSSVSVTVVDEKEIKQRGAEHLENVLNTAPNVNMSAGASRAKYIQIRGIGERSQFVTPIDPSVGLYIDGMDLSRSGGSATLFDIDQVEIVRGPQGTKYGANALAGMVNLTSREPGNEASARIESTLGNDGQKGLGVAAGGPLIKDKLLGRFSLYSNQANGSIDNLFLGRDDTNNIDEITARGHLKWFATDDLNVDLRYLHLNIDNGYDAFTLDNSRNSYADQPGKDKQKTNAFSLGSEWEINPKVRLQSSVSHSNSDLEYSYDEDWSYVGQFDPAWEYSSFDQYLRKRKNTSLDARLLSNEEGRIFNDKSDWTLGLYYSDKSEDLQRNYTYLDAPFFSQYKTQNSAIYGQLDTQINQKLSLISGLRIEKWKADYSDSDNVKIPTDEVLYGGKLGIEYEHNENQLSYATLSRGYKAGGVNPDNQLPLEKRDFGTEYLWNFEVGLNSSFLNDELSTRLSAFYAKRNNQHIKRSILETREDGSTDFIDYLDNAGKGHNIGLEAALNWQVNSQLNLKSSLGLLQAKIDDFPEQTDLENRDQAHAPRYQYSLGAEYAFNNHLKAGISLEGKDGFYFSDSHNAKAKSYNLLNANLVYKKGDWSTTLWGRNLLNKDYDVRGFSFGNNPAKFYETETYTQKGEPRMFGVTFAYDFN